MGEGKGGGGQRRPFTTSIPTFPPQGGRGLGVVNVLGIDSFVIDLTFRLNMLEEKVKVVAYSGYRGEETPRTILLHGTSIEVTEILNQWIEETLDDRTTKRFYQIKGDDGVVRRIYYNEKTMEWFCKVEA